MDNKLVLGYWPIRGLAQPIRAMLHYLELPFEDKLYNDYKLWFETDRPSFKNPLANLPYLKVGEKVVFESDAIYYQIAHTAKRSDLLGKDADQQVELATIRGVIGDLKSLIIPYFYNKDQFEADKPRVLKGVEEYFEEFSFILKKHKYLTGDTITYVDFMLWEYIDEILVFHPETVHKFEELVRLHKHIAEIPQIAKFISSEGYIARPFNSPAIAAFY